MLDAVPVRERLVKATELVTRHLQVKDRFHQGEFSGCNKCQFDCWNKIRADFHWQYLRVSIPKQVCIRGPRSIVCYSDITLLRQNSMFKGLLSLLVFWLIATGLLPDADIQFKPAFLCRRCA